MSTMSDLHTPTPWLQKALAQEGATGTTDPAPTRVPLRPSPESVLQARYDAAAKRAAKEAKKAKKAKRQSENWRHPDPDA
jgi:hypothetical protein